MRGVCRFGRIRMIAQTCTRTHVTAITHIDTPFSAICTCNPRSIIKHMRWNTGSVQRYIAHWISSTHHSCSAWLHSVYCVQSTFDALNCISAREAWISVTLDAVTTPVATMTKAAAAAAPEMAVKQINTREFYCDNFKVRFVSLSSK